MHARACAGMILVQIWEFSPFELLDVVEATCDWYLCSFWSAVLPGWAPRSVKSNSPELLYVGTEKEVPMSVYSLSCLVQSSIRYSMYVYRWYSSVITEDVGEVGRLLSIGILSERLAS